MYVCIYIYICSQDIATGLTIWSMVSSELRIPNSGSVPGGPSVTASAAPSAGALARGAGRDSAAAVCRGRAAAGAGDAEARHSVTVDFTLGENESHFS